MKFALRFCLGWALIAAVAPAEPLRVIFDTDMGNDIDDALALCMLHSFERRKEIQLLAITVTKDNPWAPRFVSAVNTFYGRGAIPIGMVANGKTNEDGKYNRQTLEGKRYPYSEKTEEAVGLIRRLLKAAPDQSVALVQVGFSTNLARLLSAKEDIDLLTRKVKLLSVMGGDFGGGKPEYNIRIDIPEAKRLFSLWPTPIVVSGFEVGKTIKYPAVSIQRDFAWAAHHPVAEAYGYYMKMPYDRETWDLTSVLYAVRPDRGYFDLSPPGTIVIDDQGNSKFAPGGAGKHRYLIVNDVQRARILESFVFLATEPPGR